MPRSRSDRQKPAPSARWRLGLGFTLLRGTGAARQGMAGGLTATPIGPRPALAKPFFARYGNRVIEPEIKLIFVCLLVLMTLADASNGHAVLPAFILGMVMSRHFQEHRSEQDRLRVVAFAFLTPFFFIKGGLNVSLGAVFANLGVFGGPVRDQALAEARVRVP